MDFALTCGVSASHWGFRPVNYTSTLFVLSHFCLYSLGFLHFSEALLPSPLEIANSIQVSDYDREVCPEESCRSVDKSWSIFWVVDDDVVAGSLFSEPEGP